MRLLFLFALTCAACFAQTATSSTAITSTVATVPCPASFPANSLCVALALPAIAGPPGPAGASVPGPQGKTGPAGASVTGPQGPPGASVTGPAGPPGPAGAPADTSNLNTLYPKLSSPNMFGPGSAPNIFMPSSAHAALRITAAPLPTAPMAGDFAVSPGGLLEFFAGATWYILTPTGLNATIPVPCGTLTFTNGILTGKSGC